MISVIIPVYNSEKYLNQCLNSIVNQTYKNLEIIIVNDGSTDRSIDIIKQFEASDDRVSVLQQSNMGHSQARNAGLEVCSGDYIIFFDSDDWMDESMIETLLSKAVETKADVVVCPYTYIFSDGRTHFRKIKQGTVKLDSKNKIDFYKEYLLKSSGYDFVVWNKLYKASIIKNNYFLFESHNIIFSEDTVFNFDYFLNSEIVATVKSSLCFYRQHEKSIMNSYKKDLHIKYLNLHNTLLRRIKEYGMQEELSEEFGCFSFIIFMMSVNNEKFSSDKASDCIKRIRQMINDVEMRNSILKLNTALLDKKRRIGYVLYRMKSAALIYFIAKYLGNKTV